jgi:hypothetical protein
MTNYGLRQVAVTNCDAHNRGGLRSHWDDRAQQHSGGRCYKKHPKSLSPPFFSADHFIVPAVNSR